ncbi:MAG: OmpH family outer membrane protein [Acidobacteria bacterium]|nr:OmpH family outer membrane protein [Acidobacteriota bacterium]
MKGFAVIGTISLMVASPAFAQTPAAPAAPAPASAPAPAPPRPFPEGSKVAYVVLQRIANESAQGRTATGRIQAVQQAKAADLAEKNKQLQSFQAKLEKEASVLSSTAAGELQKQVERLQVDIQRATQDAQAEVQELQQQLQQEFQQQLEPVLQELGREKNLHFIFNGPDAGLVWADAALDISDDVIKKLDAAKPAAGSKPPVQ